MTLDFEKTGGLLPAIIQDAESGKVLMLGYMNSEALEKTIEDQFVTFYSRTKKRLWKKGETSGHFLEVKKILYDCDRDTILVKATPVGPVCHTGADTCFGESNGVKKGEESFLYELERIIKKRKDYPKEGSYTSSLFSKGLNKIAQKVGEEAVELVIEAKDNDADLFLNEAADLMYHYLILLTAKGHSLDEVTHILKKRHK